MSEYLFPVPGSVLRNLLDFKAKTGEQFSEKEAILDIMIDMDKQEIKKPRDYATRWSWKSHVTVWRRLPEYQDMAKKWRSFNAKSLETKVKQRETGLKQRETKNGQSRAKNAGSETGLKQRETRVKQADLIHTRATDTELQITDSKNINNLKGSASSKVQSIRPEKKSGRVKKAKPKVSEMIFEEGDWRRQFSKGFYNHLNERGKLGTPLKNNPEKTLNDWCHVFRKLNELRGHSREVIHAVCTWLFSDSKQARWWIDGGKLGTAEKLLSKTRSGDRYIFELLQIQMQDEATRTNKQVTSDELAAATLRLVRAS